MTFDGEDLYPDLMTKAGALGYSLVQNHPFIDGNKRVGHAATEVFLSLNGWELVASVDEAEPLVLDLASGTVTRGALTEWIREHATEKDSPSAAS